MKNEKTREREREREKGRQVGSMVWWRCPAALSKELRRSSSLFSWVLVATYVRC